MPSERARLALVDIRDNALLAREFLSGISLDELKSDRRTSYAVTRCLEIISEAALRLSPAVRERHSELPWRAIMGVGSVYRHESVYRHDYDNVAEEFVWRTVHHSLAPLLAVVETELARTT